MNPGCAGSGAQGRRPRRRTWKFFGLSGASCHRGSRDPACSFLAPSGSLRNTRCCPQSSRTGSRISLLLLGRRAHGTSIIEFQGGSSSAGADGLARGADATAGGGPKRLFDDAVFEGVVTDDHQPAARSQHRDRSFETFLQCGQFIVDRDSECLEDQGGRVMSATAACLLYTSDAADDGLGVDLGGRRIV